MPARAMRKCPAVGLSFSSNSRQNRAQLTLQSGLIMHSLHSLESLYGTGTAEITAKLAALLRSRSQAPLPDDESSEGSPDRLVQAIECHFEENEEILEQMELETRGWSPEMRPERNKADLRLQSYRVELQRLKKDFEKALRHRDRGQLGLDRGLDAENQKQSLLDNTETLERSSRKLHQGHSLLAETEAIGAAVLNDLSEQRESIQRSRTKLRDTHDDLHSSSKILTKMLMRIIQNKAILIVVFALMFLVIVLSVFYALD